MEKDNNTKDEDLKAIVKRRIAFMKPGMGCRYKGSKEKPDIFQWDDVARWMDVMIDPIPNRLPCPICDKPSEELLWIGYSTPRLTWQNLSGRMGALSLCQDCHCQVEFILLMMN